jgi:hypothetical protein
VSIQREPSRLLPSENTWLLGHRRNVHSQTGEDGVVGKILELLPVTDRWCVEFGAGDGEHLSNTRHLIEAHGYSGVLIEPDPEKFEKLERRYAASPGVHRFRLRVGLGSDDGLDAVLARTPIPPDFDFLSIDIDGNDWHVWKGVSRYAPKLVCIEFNPTIPTELRWVQEPDPALAQGCSLLALVELGRQKGYELACVLPVNAIFVRADLFPLLGIQDNSPYALRVFDDAVTWMFQTYDGEVHLAGYRQFLWHQLPLSPQRVPRPLRGFPGSFGPVRRVMWVVYGLLRAPRTFRELLRRWWTGTSDGLPLDLDWKPPDRTGE